MGKGLFSSVIYNKNDKIGNFRGIVKSKETLNSAINNNSPNLSININNSSILDCYNNYKADKDTCMCSYAKCAVNCVLKKDNNVVAENNCGIIIRDNEVTLAAKMKIPAHTELLWNSTDHFNIELLLAGEKQANSHQ